MLLTSSYKITARGEKMTEKNKNKQTERTFPQEAYNQKARYGFKYLKGGLEQNG